MITPIPPSDSNVTVAGLGQTGSVRFRLPESDEFRHIDAEKDGIRNEERFKTYLRTSLQMQHLAILCGSGTSIECGYPSMSDLWKEVQSVPKFEEARQSLSYMQGDNFEEFLSRCDAFLELNPNDAVVTPVRKATIETVLSSCGASGPTVDNLGSHQDLLKKVARRRARDSRVKLFTTNYDLCFERAAGALGIVPIDGFSFGSPRRFDPRFFDFDIVKRGTGTDGASFIPGVFQYYKLHGSVDWAGTDGTIEIDANVSAENACLIYPARAKFQRSYQQPHLELMARYLATLREPNTCLVVAGFGFNDAHLSAPIFAALRANPHFRLIVVCRDPVSKLEGAAPSSAWGQLAELALRADVSFVASSFAQFVKLIPDLTALSPAHELESAVLRVTGGAK